MRGFVQASCVGLARGDRVVPQRKQLLEKADPAAIGRDIAQAKDTLAKEAVEDGGKIRRVAGQLGLSAAVGLETRVELFSSPRLTVCTATLIAGDVEECVCERVPGCSSRGDVAHVALVPGALNAEHVLSSVCNRGQNLAAARRDICGRLVDEIDVPVEDAERGIRGGRRTSRRHDAQPHDMEGRSDLSLNAPQPTPQPATWRRAAQRASETRARQLNPAQRKAPRRGLMDAQTAGLASQALEPAPVC